MPASIHPEQLRCEDLTNPLGIGTAIPRLSWIPESGKRGARQTAYRILVASRPELLRKNQGDLWDSGKQLSAQSHYIPYGAPPLPSRTSCYWKVQLWNENDQPSNWSVPAFWSVGLLNQDDWTAQWIGLPEGTGDMTSPWLRKIFELSERPASARIFANFMGYGEIYINGQRVGDDLLGPPVCDYSKRSFYTVYDVAPLLRRGKNCLALWLGRGWYRKGFFWPTASSGPIARVQLEYNQKEGTPRRLGTDKSWEGRPSCMQLLGAWVFDQFGGEIYDATVEVPDWNQPKASSRNWYPVALIEPLQVPACAPMLQPNRIIETLKPKALKKVGPNEWLVDMGKACTGWFEIQLPYGDTGRRVSLELGDAFERGGKTIPFSKWQPGDRFNSLGQHSEYVYRGQGDEVFRNRFNYASFQFVRLTNVPGGLEADKIKAHLITTDLPTAGTFTASNPTLNQIHDTMLHTLRCLTLGGYQVDCHSRERLGYGGDGQSSLETTLTMLRSDAFYRKWTEDWIDAQRPDGGMPHTAPCPYWAGGGPFWCGFLTATTWRHYLHYGDLALLERNYPAIKRWLGYVAKFTKANLLHPWPITNYRNWYLGDWATPEGTDPKHTESINLFCNCYIVYSLEQMANIAEALGRRAEAANWRRNAARRRPAIHKAYYHPTTGVYADGDQIDLIMPLMAGVVPPPLHENVFRKFEKELLIKNKGHLATGLSGTYMMIQYLQSIGRNDLIHTFASKTTLPSWGYMVTHGATAIWEYWGNHSSRIHNCYNNIGSWFYQGLAGIYPDPAGPGFRQVIIRPALLRDLKQVRATYDSVQGKIECAWKFTGQQAVVELTIPPGVLATVQLPALSADSVKESGKKLTAAEGVEIVPPQTAGVTLKTVSGRYRFSFPMP